MMVPQDLRQAKRKKGATLRPPLYKTRWFMSSLILTQIRHQEQVSGAIRILRNNRKGHFLGTETDIDFPSEPSRVVIELPQPVQQAIVMAA